MNQLSLLSLAGLIAVCVAASIEPSPLSDAYINYINSIEGITWKAGRNFDLKNMRYVKRLLGVDIEANKLYNRLHMPVLDIKPMDDLPTSFDAREQWPNCKSIKEVRDQSACGSCWAFGSAEAMSDRICVATGNDVHISAEDINSCCTTCGGGCSGGFPGAAWNFFVDEGVVTGGQYNSSEGCRPYSLQPCEHHVTGPLPSCDDFEFDTPKCQRSCLKGYPKTYTEDKVYGRSAYTIQGVENIMTEILTKGPVTASFIVYEDFPTYKSGVYKHVTGKMVSGHAVKIIGWGVEDGVDYWLLTNSWNEDWGEKGFFKMLRGTNECDIESGIVAGLPK